MYLICPTVQLENTRTHSELPPSSLAELSSQAVYADVPPVQKKPSFQY